MIGTPETKGTFPKYPCHSIYTHLIQWPTLGKTLQKTNKPKCPLFNKIIILLISRNKKKSNWFYFRIFSSNAPVFIRFFPLVGGEISFLFLHFFNLFLFLFLRKGSINLITKALAAVGRKLELIPDPTTVHYHMPNGLSILVHRDYEDFIDELNSRFPHEADGIRGFYGECWKV